ncbi:MAG: amidohydrolase family protein [Rhizobiales bacterium]|nr:amidohydrolase family protein [Hyphomicrobiales bacterium]MBO6697901.1 amidohydrolase family protein [Hyphomicrobiales bacterium]MBO6735845.1 amidohydrolase family protein [Hyphomicrobiales bacterium]MBO6913856.1 amidohydrolase family protein [Hyphomicrobiales bacterium]MBO6955559.1 amidohydrolase family protein [Hyphomicrobiales bacterium]
MTKSIVRARWLLEGFDGETPIIHEQSAVLVVDGVVAKIGDADDLAAEQPDAEPIGSGQDLVIPGLINAHHHVGLTPFQLGSVDHPLELWFASRLGLRAVAPYLDTLYSAFEMITSGVTTVQHLHSRAPGGLEGLHKTSQEILSAYDDIGMRVSFSMALRDQNRLVYLDDDAFLNRLPERLRPRLAAYFEAYKVPFTDQLALYDDLTSMTDGKPKQQAQLAPSNLHWLSDNALQATADLAEKSGAHLHAHILETPYQKQYAAKRTGGSALATFDEMGLLSPKMTIGHGVWMSEEDIELCADRGCHVCHNCSSNMRLKSGKAPVNALLAHGIPVAIGIDEAGINDDRDMLSEMRLVMRAHRDPGLASPAPSAADVLKMATTHGASTTPFGTSIGHLGVGAQADLVMFDWKTVTWPHQDLDPGPVDILLHRAKTNAVKRVMIAGDIVYANGAFTHIDKDAVLSEIAERLAEPLTDDEVAMKKLARDMLPHVRAFYEEHYTHDPAQF